MTGPRARRWRRGLYAVAAVLAFAVVVVPLPGWIVGIDVGRTTVTPEERLRGIGIARTALLSAVAGLAVAVGAYATWRRLRINEEELRTTRDGQITERYSRAVEHLGLPHSDLRHARLSELDLAGADFDRAAMHRARLRACDLPATRWPDGWTAHPTDHDVA